MMRGLFITAGMSALMLAGCAGTAMGPAGSNAAAQAVTPGAPWIAAAVADAGRPVADRQRDANRKPAETLAFAGVQPGMAIVDTIPGGGYFTRLFAKAVGPAGKVHVYVPHELSGKFNSDDNAKALAAAYPNVRYQPGAPLTERAPEPFADLVFTAQNWHDFHTPLFGTLDMAAAVQALYSVVRPGGSVVIIDHAAQAGSGLRDVNTLHRIDEDVVKREMAAAGFMLQADSQALRNPADGRTANVFDPSIRGRTDQFMLRFRKPAR